MPNPQSGTIGCQCGKCEITVADNRAIQYFRCGCEDCRQGIEWGAVKSTVTPDQLPHGYYIPADIISIKGKEFMSAYKLREDGRSIRLYCNQCWSMIAIDHPAYQSNVFYIFPKHCVAECDLSVPLTAILFMKDYPKDYESPPEDDVPLFYSFEYDQEKKRFYSLPTVSNTFKQRTDPLKGINFTALIDSLGKLKILDLEKGKRFE